MRTTILTLGVVIVLGALIGVIAPGAQAHNNDPWEHKPCQEKPNTPTSPPSEPPSTPPGGSTAPPAAPTPPTSFSPPPTVTTPPAEPSTPPSDTQPPCAVCTSRRIFTIRLAKRSSHNVKSARVYYGERVVAMHKRRSDGRWVARITFAGQRYFPGQRDTIGIRVVYRNGSHDGMIRRYRPCEGKLGFLNKPWVL